MSDTTDKQAAERDTVRRKPSGNSFEGDAIDRSVESEGRSPRGTQTFSRSPPIATRNRRQDV